MSDADANTRAEDSPAETGGGEALAPTVGSVVPPTAAALDLEQWQKLILDGTLRGASLDCPPAGEQGAPAVGGTYGKYLLEHCLGKGGQAVVYQAYDRCGLLGHVALKISRDPIREDARAEWARNEAEPLARLNHPNVVQVVDTGFIGDYPYVATRLVEGLSLAERVKVRPPTPSQALEWMIQLASAVAAAHELGIVHRDIKPQNVLIRADDRPLLIDFGISSVASVYQDQSETGFSGTPAYMAPEQARAEPAADYRVDLFALGGVLKFMLAGAGPYGLADDPLAEARAGRVQGLDERAGPSLRRKLARVANRALAADAADRYANAGQMFAALRAIRRGRRLLAGAAAGAATAVAAVALAVWVPWASLLPAPQALPAVPAKPAALTATIEIHCQRTGQQGAYQVLTADLLPLRSGERIQLHAKLSQPLWLYVVSIGSQGEMTLVYPPKGQSPGPVSQLSIPPGRDEWIPLTPPGGTETLLLLGRREKLDPSADLPAALAALGPPPSFDGVGLLVLNDQAGPTFTENKLATLRGFGEKTVTVKKGMLSVLANQVPAEWDVVRAVSFTHLDLPGSSPATKAGRP